MNTTLRSVRLAIVLSLTVSLLAITPVSAAVTGSVALDKPFITTPGGVLKVTLTDSDLDLSAVQETHTVKVSSTQDATGFNLTVLETGPSTGKFEATFRTVTTTSDSTNADDPTASPRPGIAAVTGAIISVLYTDASPAGFRVATATVETTKPSVTIVSPAHELSTRTQATRLIAEITDSDAGVDDGTITFNIVSAVDAATGNPVAGVSTGSVVTTAITGGFRAEAVLTGVPLGETIISWNVTASDKAGNFGKSDSDPETEAQDDHVVKIDTVAPGYASPIAAETGHYWDADHNELVDDPRAAKNTSIRVIFNEAMDGTSIQASDFTVDGVPPIAADWFPGAPESVFLTVPAMASNAKPKVKVVDTIADAAGNSIASLPEKTAVDGIAPAVAVTVSPLLDQASVTIDISSDEPLLTAPVLTVNGVGPGTALTQPSLISTNLFRATYTAADAPNAYNVEAAILDTSVNARSAGKATATTTGAIVFEIDDAIPDATILVDNKAPGDVATDSPTISIDWTAEGIEYAFDTHDQVTLTAATLDGLDVLGQASTTDNRFFELPTDRLALGEREFKVTGEDEAGNSLELTVRFTVTNAAPVVDAGPDLTVGEGDTFTLTQTTFTDATVADTHTATIDWGDGVIEAGAVTESGGSGAVSGSHVYMDDDGSPFTVTVTVTDDLGLPHADALTVIVNNVDPVIEAGSDQTIASGARLDLEPAVFADAGARDTHRALVVWGDSAYETAAVDQDNRTISQSHTYPSDGIFPVTIVVIDDDGGFGVDVFSVTVGTGVFPVRVPSASQWALIALAIALGVLLMWRLRRAGARGEA